MTLAVPAIGAVTYVAYKHPAPFKTLAFVLQALCWGAVIGILVWNVSNSTAKWAAIGALSSLSFPDQEKMRHAAEEYAVPFWWYAGFLIANLYVWILLTLPVWLLDQKPIDDDKH